MADDKAAIKAEYVSRLSSRDPAYPSNSGVWYNDHRDYADALGFMLSPAYETVGIATNGLELTTLAVQFKPDLIVTDHFAAVLEWDWDGQDFDEDGPAQ